MLQHDDSPEDPCAHHDSQRQVDVSNPSDAPSLDVLIARRYSRRALLQGALAVGAIATLGGWPGARRATAAEREGAPSWSASMTFVGVAHGIDAEHHVARGYRADILLRWGDPVLADAPAFDAHAQSANAQRRQFGYNNDFVGYVPLPYGSQNSEHGLLCVNHEYTEARLMFPAGSASSAERVAIEMAAHGGSIVEVRKTGGRWQVVSDSAYARRINALDTAMRFAGPAAGSARLRTRDDPDARRVTGTIANCAGGITPWGTWLMAEENFHYYFGGKLDGNPEADNYRRYGLPSTRYAWSRHDRRFDLAAEANAANRYGWIVEVDPYDPLAVPVKRTALGRFRHEAAANTLSKDGRLVVYSGDDQAFEYLYKFVTAGKVDSRERAANRDLLDDGTLYVARFEADGTLRWLPLVHGQGGLEADNGFHDQADVVIEARRAATLLGATPLDRPEDVEPNPVNGRVYVMLTGNHRRGHEAVDAANPRAANLWGHILELTPHDGDHAATRASWRIVIGAGNPRDPATAAHWHPQTAENDWFACPDNAAVDPRGNLWVATDQGSRWHLTSGSADGLWALATDGEERGRARMLYRAPVGSEVCGPCFTPDGRTLFLAVQHPGSDGTEAFTGFGRRSSFADPATRWPDFDDRTPPRPSVVVITRDDGGPIGS